MSKDFTNITRFLKNRKKLLEELHKAQMEVESREIELQKLDAPFWELKIDISSYIEFFKKYYIKFIGDGSLSSYVVTGFDLTKDWEGNYFYEVKYKFTTINPDGSIKYQNNGDLSLRKFMHLLDHPNASLCEIIK